jgi:membrane associated rhomboid family serine protease
MIPLRDVHKPRRPPYLTRVLIVVNVTVFIGQLFQWLIRGHDTLVATMGVQPRCYFSPSSCFISLPAEADQLWKPLFASMFLHAGILHLAFNMLFLAVFGAGVEDRLGRFKFLLLYLGCGIAASITHIITHPTSDLPAIGASGAIAGVLGAYLILLPRSWILTYFPPIFLFPVPAPLFLLGWMASQILSAVLYLPGLSPAPRESGVAWMAHIGGFAAGVAVGWSVKPWWKRGK